MVFKFNILKDLSLKSSALGFKAFSTFGNFHVLILEGTGNTLSAGLDFVHS